jgi:hypothetical protein
VSSKHRRILQTTADHALTVSISKQLRDESPVGDTNIFKLFSNFFPCIAAEMARLQGDLVAEFHIEKVQPRVNA